MHVGTPVGVGGGDADVWAFTQAAAARTMNRAPLIVDEVLLGAIVDGG